MEALKWDGPELRLKTGRLLATVVPDEKYQGMFRVRTKDGQLSDMVNLSRAKDAARSLAMAAFNLEARQTPGCAHSGCIRKAFDHRDDCDDGHRRECLLLGVKRTSKLCAFRRHPRLDAVRYKRA